MVTMPFPTEVRSVVELKASRGEANYNNFNRTIEWRVSTKDGASINGVATLTGTISGPLNLDDSLDNLDAAEEAKSRTLASYYDDDSVAVQSHHAAHVDGSAPSSQAKRSQASRALVPRSIAVSFSVKGWLPSGIKVDSLNVDVKRSKGLGEGVRPVKGVKYLTISRQGVERRV